MAENIFRVDDSPGEDTRRMVREVLAFMADALYASEDEDMPSTGASLGAGHILRMCMHALKEADESKQSIAA